MNQATSFFQQKLDYMTDPADVKRDLEANASIMILDVRSPEAYALEHIPQATNFHHHTMNAESTQHLDRSITYITYCDGIGCNGSTKGALKLSQLGFTVKEMLGGLEWWKKDGYQVIGTNITPVEEMSCHCD